MAKPKALLNSYTLKILRGFLKCIFEVSSLSIFDCNSICIYKKTEDLLSNIIKPLILDVIKDEIDQLYISNNPLKCRIEELSLISLTKKHLMVPGGLILTLEERLQDEIHTLIEESEAFDILFIVFEVYDGIHFKRSARSRGDDYENSDDQLNKSAFESPSDNTEEAIERILVRFIERWNIQYSKPKVYLILIFPFSKPPDFIFSGLLDIVVPMTWDTSISNMRLLIQEILDTEIETEALNAITSVLGMNCSLSSVYEITQQLVTYIKRKKIGQPILKGLICSEIFQSQNKVKITFEDIKECIEHLNRSRLTKKASSSLDMLISSKISIDKDFIGLCELRQYMKQAVYLMVDQFSSENSKITYPITWLLWGPPGCGKSTLVRSLTSIHPKVNLILGKMTELINSLHGITTRNLRSLFEKAYLTRPCILVFDDIEDILGNSFDIEFRSDDNIRTKIHQELTSTLIYMLDSILTIEETQLEGKSLSIDNYQNREITPKLNGLMIIFTTKLNPKKLPKWLIDRIKKQSLMLYPNVEELSQMLTNSKESEVIYAHEKIIEEVTNCTIKGPNNTSPISVSDFEYFTQQILINKYLT
ncbi:ATPase, AAA family protein [Cryptosporidium serpentis]